MIEFDDDDRCTHLESILVQNRIREERVSSVFFIHDSSPQLCSFCRSIPKLQVKVSIRNEQRFGYPLSVISNGQLKKGAASALERTGVAFTAVKSNMFETPNHDRQKSLFAKGSIDTAEHFSQCVNAVCKYIKLSEKPNLKAETLDMSRYLRLDSSAQLNLHLDSHVQNESTIAKFGFR